MIDPTGRCVEQTEDKYRYSMDFNRAAERNIVLPNATEAADSWRLGQTQYWQFPAVNATYCAEEDSVCRRCVDKRFWAYTTPDSRYCVGQDGCVCIYACEYRMYVNEVECVTESNMNSTSAPDPGTNTAPFNTIMATGLVAIIAVIALLALGCLADKVYRRQRQRLEHERWHVHRTPNFQRSSALGVNQLSLTGWLHHRQDLIDKEQQQLASTAVRDNGPVYLDNVQDRATEVSARRERDPQGDGEDSTSQPPTQIVASSHSVL